VKLNTSYQGIAISTTVAVVVYLVIALASGSSIGAAILGAIIVAVVATVIVIVIITGSGSEVGVLSVGVDGGKRHVFGQPGAVGAEPGA
jgi:hypothetical protein